MNARKRVLALLLAVGMSVTICGCAKKGSTNTEVDLTGEIPESMSIFCNLSSGIMKAGGTSYNDVLTYQLMEEKTGCHIDWIHPASGALEQTFNTTIASGELPDAIIYEWRKVSGGIEQYVEDDVIVDLTPYIEECMPNFNKIINENPEMKSEILTNDGRILTIPYLRLDKELGIYQGPMVRQDWLDKLGLEEPTTPEELKEVLIAFREQDANGNGEKDEVMGGIGFGSSNYEGIANLLWGFGTTWDFHVKDGEVVYGPATKEFKDGLEYIADLYKNDLIDKDYLLNDKAKYDAKITGDKYGYVFGIQPTTYQTSMDDGNRSLTAAAYLKAEDGKNYSFNHQYVMNSTLAACFAVTTANENVAGTLKWLDTFYSEEGIMMSNFGEEGLTYEMKDGEPVFTDYIDNNPNGKSRADMINLTLSARSSSVTGAHLWDCYKQTLSSWGISAIEKWVADAPVTERVLSPYIKRSVEDNEEYSEIMTPITTYVSEQASKVVIGKMSIDEWDKIVETLYDMDLERALEIQNVAYEAYLAK